MVLVIRCGGAVVVGCGGGGRLFRLAVVVRVVVIRVVVRCW